MATEQAQLSVFEDLGIFEENVSEVLSVLTDEMPEGGEEVVKKTRVVLFTGHMIDAEDRPKARFPKTSESAAKDLIRGALEELIIGEDEELIGIAGAASGGDILFLEVCEEMGIPVSIHLALDRENFVKASVAGAGASWIDRFDRLCASHPTNILKEGREAPIWNPKASNWERANLWMLNAALSYGGSNVTLLALWDGSAGDGPGGTAHMVEAVEDRAGRVIILDAGQLVPIASGTTGVMAAIDPQTRTPRAFVIYSSMDAEFVDRELTPFLNGCGMRVSCDQVLKVSDAAAEGLSQLINSSDLVFVVISKNAVASKKVKDHTDLAIRNDKDLVLACLDESEPGRIHARLRFAFAVDLQDERERDDLAERISKIR